MDPLVLAVVVAGLIVMAWLAAALGQVRGAPPGAPAREPTAPSGAGKVAYLIERCRGHLSPDKLRRGNDRYTHYYVAYLHEVARAVARAEGVAFTTAFQVPVLLEAVRLCGDGRSSAEGPRLISRILSSPPGRQGAADGRADGAEATDPTSSGPFWTRIHGYFEETSAVR